MAEYIEREALMKFPIRRDHCDKERANEHFINGIETVLEYAESLPAADVAPVVRCKDCKHEFGGSCIICGFQRREPEDFCSYGERRDGDTDGS